MIGYYNYTVIATYLGLFSALYGIAAVMRGQVFTGIVCLIISGLLDAFDGKIARTRNSTRDEKSFGIQLDSLIDLVAFGVLPAVIGYYTSGLSSWFLAFMLIYVLAALIRLAYFNVTEYNRQQTTTEGRHSYEGLPVTSAALIFPLVWCFKAYLGKKFVTFYALVMLATAILFISPFNLKKANNKGLAALIICGAVIFGLLVLQRI